MPEKGSFQEKIFWSKIFSSGVMTCILLSADETKANQEALLGKCHRNVLLAIRWMNFLWPQLVRQTNAGKSATVLVRLADPSVPKRAASGQNGLLQLWFDMEQCKKTQLSLLRAIRDLWSFSSVQLSVQWEGKKPLIDSEILQLTQGRNLHKGLMSVLEKLRVAHLQKEVALTSFLFG